MESIRLDRLQTGIFDDFGSVSGIALTIHPLLRPDAGKMQVFSCSSAYGKYAFVSYHKMSDGFPEVLAKMVQRQAGLLFIPTHCTAGCLLQGVSDFNDFVAKCVVPDLDLCLSCRDKIKDSIGSAHV